MAKKNINMDKILKGLSNAVEKADPYVPKVGYIALLTTAFCWGWMKADLDILKEKDQNH